MRIIFWSLLVLVLPASCRQVEPMAIFRVDNVLMPLELPVTVRSIQSRAVRPLELPEMPGKIGEVRLAKAEIGNPDFPNLNFAGAIRLSLVDPGGQVILIAESGRVARNQATIRLQPVGKPDILRCFLQDKLDMVLEVDNTIPAEQGIMLIGNFEFNLYPED